MTAEPSPPLAPEPDDKSDEQSSSLPLWLIVLAVLILGGTVGLIIYGYVEKPGWIGSSGKQFWDYLDLLIVPAALALGVYWLNRRETERQDQAQAERERERRDEVARREREREVTEEARRARERAAQAAQRERELEVENQRAQDEALQAYLDQTGQLLLEKDLRGSEKGSEVRSLARARTLTVLARLDGARKGSVVTFLYEAGLIGKPIVLDLKGADLKEAVLKEAVLKEAVVVDADLSGAVLSGANLYQAFLVEKNLSGARLISAYLWGINLSKANLSGVDLKRTILHRAELFESNLSEADLRESELHEAHLFKADLSGADLSGADLSNANLSWADLTNANLSGTDLFQVDLSHAQGWTAEQLTAARTLEIATMPNGQKYEDWLKDREDRKND